MFDETLIRYVTESLPDWVETSAWNVASQVACGANGGDDSEVLLSSKVTQIKQLTPESAIATFAKEVGVDAHGVQNSVYRIDWVVWVCSAKFNIHNPWEVSRRQEHIYIVASELLNADFTNDGMGTGGSFLKWIQEDHTNFDASSSRDVSSDVSSQVGDLVSEWGYEVAEWFGDDDDEPLTAKHHLFVGMKPNFRKKVISAIKANR